jgi:hypothetical protein
MKCIICGNLFPSETSFCSLFSFERYCAKCKVILAQKSTFESIPFDNGLLDYVSIYGQQFISLEKEIYFFQGYEETLKLAIFGPYKYDVILFIDQIEYNLFSNWFEYVKKFGRILLMSLTYFDFSSYMMIF